MEKPDTPGRQAARAALRGGKTLLRSALWPMGNNALTYTLERLLYGAFKVQALRYYWLSGGDRRPHFPHSRASFYTSYLDKAAGPALLRGFYARQAVRRGGTVLNIGCGDGFTDYFFLSDVAGSVDAVDVEPAAIETAKRYHRAKNVRFLHLNPADEPFPRATYDTILMDGCIAHFAPDALERLLAKIVAALGDESIYSGSEVLETPDKRTHDHLQSWATPAEMERFLARYFPHVNVWREQTRSWQSFVHFRCAKTLRAFDRMEDDVENNMRRVRGQRA